MLIKPIAKCQLWTMVLMITFIGTQCIDVHELDHKKKIDDVMDASAGLEVRAADTADA